MDTPDGRGTVIEVDLLRQRVKVRMENQETTGTYANADIAVFRNGKAKKSDPPVPDDWAPISGNSRSRRREQPEEEMPNVLDPIRLRYSTETIAEEQVIPEEKPAEEAEEKQGRSRRRRRPKGKHQGGEAQQEEKPAQQKKEQPKKEQPKKEQPKKEQPEQPTAENKGDHKRRRRPPHRRRPKSGGEPKAE